MPELSPQAQAVWDAYELVDCDPYKIDPRKAGLSAALEDIAARGECVEIVTAPGFREIDAVLRVSDILAIAAELRCGTTTTETP